MFDIKLLKSKFYMKSKSAIMVTKTRITRIKRKRKAMQKFLKKDIADLLKNGLDLNAYGRVEGLWNELNLSRCYDFVEEFCTKISTHLTTMDKQRDCPDECREAVSSLMFAAARFAHLPELQELRNVFVERYSTSLDHYVNIEFINKLKSMTPPTKDMKLQFMQEIATQCGVEWNMKNLEQKLLNPTPVFSTKGSNGNDVNTPDMVNTVHNVDKKDADNQTSKNEYISEDEITELPTDENVVTKREKRTHLTCTEQEDTAASQPVKDNQVDKSVMKEENKKPLNLCNGFREEEDVEMKPFYYKTIRLPSYKSNISYMNSILKTSEHVKEDHHLHQPDSITETKPKPKSVRTRNHKPINASDTRKSDSFLEAFPQQDNFNGGVGIKMNAEKNGPPMRRASLPAEFKAAKGSARMYSFRPEMLSPKGHHHSKPPDYEDFVARMEAFRGNLK